MTDEEKISNIALILGDIPGGPYYPMFTEEQYKQFLAMGKGDVNRALMYAAISATYFTSGESSREVIGELQISSSTSANYMKLLDYIKDSFGKIPPPNLMPWFAGADKRDCNKLLDFSRCDKPLRWQKTTGDPYPADSGDC
jgi:hypothetical protein